MQVGPLCCTIAAETFPISSNAFPDMGNIYTANERGTGLAQRQAYRQEKEASDMAKLMMVVLWPSFLVAIVAEGFFFSLFDPHDLAVVGIAVELPPLAVYTLGFFCFWVFCALASMLTCYLGTVPNEKRVPF